MLWICHWICQVFIQKWLTSHRHQSLYETLRTNSPQKLNSSYKCPEFQLQGLLHKASFLKEVSQKCFVFDLQSFVFEGSLAEMLRFWSSKLRFWRKSRTNVSFLSFKASFLKEVSQNSFSQSVSQLVRSISQSVSQPVSQSDCQSVSQWVSQSVSESLSQLVSQSASQLVSQSVK